MLALIMTVIGVFLSARKRRSKSIYIEANIGAGKSTVMDKLRGNFATVNLAEPVDQWINFEGVNMLEKISNDPGNFALTFQTMCAVTITELVLPYPQKDIIQERSLHSIEKLFGALLFQEGHLKEYEFKILRKMITLIRTLMDREEHFTYLKLTPQESFRRTQSRGRPEESKLPIRYFEKLHQQMEKWMKSEPNIIEIDAMQGPDEVYQQVSEAIKRILEG